MPVATGTPQPALPTELETSLVDHTTGHQPSDMETHPEPPRLPLVLACNGPPPLMRNPVRVAHGLYTDLSTREMEPWRAAEQLSPARCVAACMQVPSALALSHESAALVHGLWVQQHEPDISLAMSSRSRRTRMSLPPAPGGRRNTSLRRRRGSWEKKDITEVSGLPVTTVLRTAMDWPSTCLHERRSASSTRLCAASLVHHATTTRNPSSAWKRFNVDLKRWLLNRGMAEVHGAGGVRRTGEVQVV